MPAWAFAMLVGLAPLLEALVFRLLVSVGVGVVTYTGVSVLFTSIQAEMVSTWGGAVAQVLAIAYLMKIDMAINLIFSAVTARLTLMGLSALGSVSKFHSTGGGA